MITPENGAQYITNRYWRPKTFYGLSTDAKPTANNVAGMWETVGGQMFYNAGTGDFIVPA